MSGIENQTEARYVPDSDYVLREVVGEFLLIPTGKLSMTTNRVVTISESAAYLWSRMKGGKTVQELCDLLCQEYDVDRETALADVREMAQGMCEMGIVTKQV